MCQNITTTRLGQNLLVLIKKKSVQGLYLSAFSCFPPLSCGSYGISLFFLLTFLVFLMSFFPISRFMAFMLSHLRSCTSRPPTTQTEVTVTDAKTYTQSKHRSFKPVTASNESTNNRQIYSSKASKETEK